MLPAFGRQTCPDCRIRNGRCKRMDAIYGFARNIVGTDYEAIPGEAIEAAKREILDSLATALGGSSKAGIGELVDMVKEWGGSEQSTVIAYGFKCPAPIAGYLYG